MLPDGLPEAYRTLDTAVLEALILTGPLGPDRGRHLAPARPRLLAHATRRRSTSSSPAPYDAAFFLRATPVDQVRRVAETGINMPPKSTYFYPKVPTGLLFNPLL